MATSTPVCGICDLRHINKPSVVWCFECEEGLCDSCKEHHDLSKASRKHSTIPITEYLSLPKNILQIKDNCEEHDEKFQLFCKQHECPCCRLCAVDKHKKCEDVTAIERIIQNVKISETFQETEQSITDILETIREVRKTRIDNLSSVQQQRKNVEKEILVARTHINRHLDQIQDTLLKKLVELETKVQKQTTDVLVSMDKDENQLNYYQTTMSIMKQYATDLQTFIYIHDIERDIASIENAIEIRLKTEIMNNTTLSFQIDKMVKQLPLNTTTFGKIIVESQTCELTISRRKNRQAQMMVVAPPLSPIYRSITLKLQQTIETKLRDTAGCALLPDGRIIMGVSAYNQSGLLSINKDLSIEFDIDKLSCNIFDMAYVADTNTIAVTSGSTKTKCITLIDMECRKIKKIIPVGSYCYGIVYRNSALIYCVPQGLHMINLNDNTISDVLVCKMSEFARVCAHKDKLYYTNYDTNTVTCCDLHGDTQWQFKDDSILRHPCGLTSDNEGNVYVVCEFYDHLVFISSNGQQGRQLLDREDGLNDPRVIHYDKSTNRLLIANQSYVALLFHATRSQ